MKLAIAILVLGSVAWAQQVKHPHLWNQNAVMPTAPDSKGVIHCPDGYSFQEEHPEIKNGPVSCLPVKQPPTVTSVAPLYDTSHPNLNSPNCYDQPDGSTFCPFEKSSDQKTELGTVVTDKPVHVAPLKCGKYQHVDTVIDCSEAKNGHVLCPFDDAPTKQTCADDIHPLTEREWQEIMARLKKLEHPPINWDKFCGTTVNGVTITCHQ